MYNKTLEVQLRAYLSWAAQKEALKCDGYLYIPDLPPNFDWKGHAQELTQTQLMHQDNGEYIYHVKSVTGYQPYSDSRSQNELRPHTEASYLSLPLKYLALWCITPAQCGGGYTTLADGNEFLQTLTQEEQKRLMKYRYEFISKERSRKITAPILEFSQYSKLMLRFSY